ncbi:MAG TPA: 1-acyl-sn-glycerol-3-phosphate acyltransferase [Actinomycetota bacterium]
MVLAPIAVALGIAAVVLAAPVLAAAAVVDLVLRRPFATTRLVAVALIHMVFEAVGVVCLTGLWLAGVGAGGVRAARAQSWHHAFLRWWLGSLIGVTGRLVGIRVEIEARQEPKPGPVLVFSRHAGPWDSFLLAYALVGGYRRRPRIVMKDAMQWSPVVDLIGNRLPNRFIRVGRGDRDAIVSAIKDLARDLGDHDALILFPEGGNFSARRRLAAISRLVREGHHEHAREAEMITNLIAPRPGGVLAAMRGAPDADVVFVAHTGLEPLASLGELWRRVPLRRALVGRYWRVPPNEIPPDESARVDWLFGWWERIDTWIDAHRLEEPRPAPARPPSGGEPVAVDGSIDRER